MNCSNSYPIEIPKITIEPNLDFILLELPPRYMPMMPYGLGLVHNILQDSDVRFQTIDSNIILYHRYHSQKWSKSSDSCLNTINYDLKKDPWDITNSSEWSDSSVIGYFWPQLLDIVYKIADADPNIVGISLNGNNRKIAKRFVRELRERVPEVVIVVGGYDCVYSQVGPHRFNNFDYMVIGEAELTLIPLIKKILNGKKPEGLPGIISKRSVPQKSILKSLLPKDLDAIDFPKYEWCGTSLYQTYDCLHLIPITGSRGCNWGKCRFCAECFPYRKRSPHKVVDEIEFMYRKGFVNFHFNESDVNGDQVHLYDICSEIIKRNLSIQIVGQARIDRKNTKEFFSHLAKAGFKHLRFGVDGWTNNTLKLMRKGYNFKVVFQNLKDCHSTGIFTAVNVVLGVPEETEADVNESISNLLKCKEYIDAVEGINILLLLAGSEYYNFPEKYKIKFLKDKKSVFSENPYNVPPDLWFSEDPYIDDHIRQERFNKVCKALYSNGINIGHYAERIIKEMSEKGNIEEFI